MDISEFLLQSEYDFLKVVPLCAVQIVQKKTLKEHDHDWSNKGQQ